MLHHIKVLMMTETISSENSVHIIASLHHSILHSFAKSIKRPTFNAALRLENVPNHPACVQFICPTPTNQLFKSFHSSDLLDTGSSDHILGKVVDATQILAIEGIQKLKVFRKILVNFLRTKEVC